MYYFICIHSRNTTIALQSRSVILRIKAYSCRSSGATGSPVTWAALRPDIRLPSVFVVLSAFWEQFVVSPLGTPKLLRGWGRQLRERGVRRCPLSEARSSADWLPRYGHVVVVVIIAWSLYIGFSWSFSGTVGEFHYSALNFLIVALSFWRAIDIRTEALFCFQICFLVIQLQFLWLCWLTAWQNISCSTFAEFLYFFFAF